MPITTADIKLLASQVMSDVPEGGGAPTGNVIPDGASNALFPDVTEAARAGGRIQIRQVSASIQSADTTVYMDGNVIVALPPNDPNVSITIMKAPGVFARRTAVANAIESYLVRGSMWGGYLLENHVVNMRRIELLQRPGASLPPVGRTLVLVFNEGAPSEVVQFVRTTRVEVESRTFTEATGGGTADFQADVVKCDISDKLRYNFPGSPASRSFAGQGGKTVVRDTTVADAGSYAGVVPLRLPLVIGDSTLFVSSIYTQLVPNARTESIALDQKPAAQRTLTLATAPRNVSVGVAAHTMRIKVGQENRGFSWTQLLRPLPAAGTVIISYRALGNWYSVQDDGAGVLTGAGVGTINYLTGSLALTLPSLPDVSSAIIFSWGEKANFVNRSGQAGFRAPEFAFQLEHPGAIPGTVVVTWTSGNVVKTVTDAAGKFTGADMVGEVDYTSSMLCLRPLAMLDAGGQFAIAYQTSSQVTESLAPTVDAAGFMALALTQTPVAGTVLVQWVTVRKVSNTSGSALNENSTSKNASTATSTAYKSEAYTTVQRGAMVSGGGGNTGVGIIQQLPVVVSGVRQIPYSVTTQTDASSGSQHRQTTMSNSSTSIEVLHEVSDNGTGGFAGSRGTINYAAKTLSIKAAALGSATGYSNDYEKASTFNSVNGLNQGVVNGAVSNQGGGGSSSANGGASNSVTTADEVVANTTVAVTYKTGTITPQNRSYTFTPPIVTIDLCPYTQDPVVQGSVMFTWMGTVYIDFEGKLYRGRTDSNPGIVSGEMNYLDGTAIMSDYVVSGNPTSLTLNSLYTRKTGFRTSQIFGGTSASPVKPSGFVLSVTDITGQQLVSTAGLNGQLSGPHMIGRIDYESGVYELLFGDYVLDTALTPAQKLEWWYSAADVEANGKIFVPWPVLPETLRYNSVSYFYLPLDADLLGIDPVRLPQDGRVSIFQPGFRAVIGNTKKITNITAANGNTINCARTRLSRVRVIGADGNTINTGYTANLEAGTLTFVNVTGYAQPVTVEHRIEDMVVLTDVGIDGTLKSNKQITHDYPVLDTYVSSALMTGDLYARMSVLFSQTTWTGVWVDAVIGTEPIGRYNDLAAPIVVTNAGAMTQRWALRFKSSGTFEVFGENVGVVASDVSINVDCAPINPITGQPYFTVRAIGWGGGWSAGNVVRLNTIGAIYTYNVIRTVQAGPESGTDYSFTLLQRGDVDRP